MSKYKAGQSIVIDILEISDDGCYKLGNENITWWSRCTSVDEMAEPLTDYTMPLINKIERQAKSITSLLNQNADLKRENAELEAKYEELRKALNEFNKRVDDMCNTAKAAGEEAAWELAGKLLDMDYIDFKKIFGITSIKNIINQGYTEVAAKVEAYERQNEICVGDVVRINNANRNGVVICEDFNVVSIIIPNGSVIVRAKEECTKTGRRIDVDAWLAQIGGDRNG